MEAFARGISWIKAEVDMEKSEMIEILDRAKERMSAREETGRSCMMAIIAALGYIIERMDVKADTAQQMAAVEESVPKTEKKPVKKRNIVDYGKIVALYKAGWSQKKIGEEMGGESDINLYGTEKI